jgi:hypothetical protein
MSVSEKVNSNFIPLRLVEYSLLLQNKEKWFVLLTFNCMDFNTTIDIIIKDLKDAREIIDDLKNYPGVPQLQVELAKSKCKSAEEIIALLKTYKSYQEPKQEERKESPVHDPQPEDDKIENLIEISEEDSNEVFEHQVIEDSENKLPDDSFTAKGQKQDDELLFNRTDIESPAKKSDSATAATIEKKPKDKKTETNIVADRFSHMSNIFNEQLGSMKNDDDISAILKTKPVTNLADAIGLNDKFLFVREIFGGSQTTYEEAINRLNNVNNLPDAKAIIMSYTDESDDNEVVKQLLDLVKRKLPSDG